VRPVALDVVPLGQALPPKWESAALLALALASLLVRGGERVALLGAGPRPPAAGSGWSSSPAASARRAAREPLPPPARCRAPPGSCCSRTSSTRSTP
jgi:uncharacterized protein (DUF58 family)